MHIISSTKSLYLARDLVSYMPDATLVDPAIKRYRSGELCAAVGCSMPVEVVVVASIITHDDLIEVVSIVDAVKRAGAKTVTLVAPYIFYTRQDEMQPSFSSLGIEVVAKIITSCGISRLITLDMHNIKAVKFFDCEVKNISIGQIIEQYFLSLPKEYTVVAPDKGSMRRLSSLKREVIAINKYRHNDKITMTLSADVRDKECLIIDDIFDSGNTILSATQLLKESGARNVAAYVTHFLGDKVPSSLEIYTTDTVPLVGKQQFASVFSIGGLLGKAIVS